MAKVFTKETVVEKKYIGPLDIMDKNDKIVVLNKTAIMERCIRRVLEEHQAFSKIAILSRARTGNSGFLDPEP